MKPVEEIRRTNLNLLIEEFEGLTNFCNLIEKSDSQVSQWATGAINSGTGNKRNISPASCRYIEEKTKKPKNWMDYEHSKASYNNTEEAPNLVDDVRIPVVGEVQGGDDGYLEELEYPVGHGEGYVLYPSKDKNAFALRVRGESMHPRYRSGEFVIVEPSIQPQPGEDVVVSCKNGRKMLKVFNWERDDEAQFLSINNGFAPITLKLNEIQSIFLVSGRASRRAFYKN